MRLFYFALLWICSITIQAQDIANLSYGNTIAIDEVDVEFVGVLEDSRCPLNVNCIQAGKAVVLVNVYANGRFLEEQRLEFYPSGFNNHNINTLFNTDGLRITGLNLLPYPIALLKTSNEAYILELVIDY